METNHLILVKEFCTHHKIELSFIDGLHDLGLIEVVNRDDRKYLAQNQLRDVEKLMRLHYDLEINMEGIDVISHLLKKICELQHELTQAKNKLRFFSELK
ncbi:MAG: MerR family transcriptional regulator [Bacteroidetes bacterium]|jgi:hypothetical protein|nr:MerR family transcriptional regulator [Bacteroidota bacterium]MDF2453078.1 MerR family transcriptional regulator [Bacteroidota bacterium]